MATNTPFEVISHTRKVCSLYKRMTRNLQAYYHDRARFRYEATLLRAEFDKHKDEKDMIKATRLLKKAEQDLYANLHYQPIKFPSSPGGVAYDRNAIIPDDALDFWDPVEKAFYPKYFALREQRKKEYMELWQKKYGKVDPKQYEEHH
ncbi:NADH dehydrogenase [ubiquinone] 1 beta subcomplex subunit 9 [Frankliniella fusca]|uniref:NADH dehydrogenase [ubiquinone] 1 beta subcomplex subunit 9 n=1 Tax=Frankliniella fusca TaxID=407009 RepID=A0AAE1HBD0_9NEOP|nr:NADH dehydrogenase [ubiquinone] 1 beta subcomplex subunit 9 [Frankliniella fusca]